MSTKPYLILLASALAWISVTLILANFAQAQSFVPLSDTVLHIFQGGSDGALPAGGVVLDAKGNVYGATTYGGNGGTTCLAGSCGTVYELTPPAQPGGTWAETILYNFGGKSNNSDGELPNGGLIMDAAGNLYGLTAYGGAGNCLLLGGDDGCGTIYELSPPSQPGGAWTKTTLYSFQGGTDGDLGIGNLTFDQAGNLYGATEFGGGFGVCNAGFYQNCGTVFELSPPKAQGGAWTEKVLYSFKGGTDGANPTGGLVLDKDGAIYGTTFYGGAGLTHGGSSSCRALNLGCGTVFRLLPPFLGADQFSEEVLYKFQGYPDGNGPAGNLVRDSRGDLFGTTIGGGTSEAGTIFQLIPPNKSGQVWQKRTFLNFGSSVNAAEPMAGLIEKDGDLFGTTYDGGSYAAGIVFRVAPHSVEESAWSFTMLCDFPPGNQESEPESQLTFDSSGALYGTAVYYGRTNNGAVFRVAP